MAKPELIIVEGCQGSGKTTLTNFLRENIPYSQLFRLSGNRFSGNMEDVELGEMQSFLNHMAVAELLMNTRDSGNHAILDRCFLSEAVYSSLYRGGSFDKFLPILIMKYEVLKLFYNVKFVMLLTNPKTLSARLQRDKAVFGVHDFDITKSNNQQREYLKHINNLGKLGFDTKVIQNMELDGENDKDILEMLYAKTEA